MSAPLLPAEIELIDALAEILVRDYLTAQPASQQAGREPRTNPVPLPDLDAAA